MLQEQFQFDYYFFFGRINMTIFSHEWAQENGCECLLLFVFGEDQSKI